MRRRQGESLRSVAVYQVGIYVTNHKLLNLDILAPAGVVGLKVTETRYLTDRAQQKTEETQPRMGTSVVRLLSSVSLGCGHTIPILPRPVKPPRTPLQRELGCRGATRAPSRAGPR